MFSPAEGPIIFRVLQIRPYVSVCVSAYVCT
jgi:hypothetical protein